MSASTTPTFWPEAARAAARFTVTDDLPTPPLPLATAYTRVSEDGWANGICGSARPPRPWGRGWTLGGAGGGEVMTSCYPPPVKDNDSERTLLPARLRAAFRRPFGSLCFFPLASGPRPFGSFG